jgi:hypothetical protein
MGFSAIRLQGCDCPIKYLRCCNSPAPQSVIVANGCESNFVPGSLCSLFGQRRFRGTWSRNVTPDTEFAAAFS